ncbi:MAG: 50S ribosomal protein L9, partial [Alphaproteobacteria bacterium]|nr:50S ribosomal protein L9 [Alphaproteobacteria bacterium]
MQVILLERIEKLGQMGDVVDVKAGYARNFLLPQKKALRATKDNISHFETQKKQLEAQNLERRAEAETVAKKMEGLSVVLVRQASESDQLYGSVTARDILVAMEETGFTLHRKQLLLDHPFKTLGLHKARVALHPEVIVEVTVNVSRSAEEAKLRTKGKDAKPAKAGDASAPIPKAEEVFEESVLEEMAAVEEGETATETEAETTAAEAA